MVQVMVFVVVLATVFALKAVAIMRTHDELAQDSAQFSWVTIRPQDEATAASWAEEEAVESASQSRVVVGHTARLRQVGA